MWAELMNWIDLNGGTVIIITIVLLVIVWVLRKLWNTEKNMLNAMNKAKMSSKQLNTYKEHKGGEDELN